MVIYRRLFYVLKYTCGLALRWRFAVSAAGRRMLAGLDPPYLLLSNHVCMWDPPMVAAFLRHPPHFLATDNMFRATPSRLLYRIVGAVPKAKDQPDLTALGAARKLIADGAVVGIFPEGRRTWDGRTLPLHPATGRLPRLLRAQVITADIDGGYLTRPRWARQGRRGRIVIRYRRVATEQEAVELSPAVLEDRIARALARNADADQARAPVRYQGRRRAEHIELFLVYCPCGALGAFRSRGNRFWCSVCGLGARVSEWGRLDGYPVPTISALSDWQEEHLVPHLAEWPVSDRTLEQSHVRLLRAIGLHGYRTIARGPAVLTAAGLSVGGHSIRIATVEACNMQNDNSIEFSVGRFRYRLEQPPRSRQYHRAPYYLWMCVIRACAAAAREGAAAAREGASAEAERAATGSPYPSGTESSSSGS